ncbi:MAG: hypothetical protein U1E47_09655 [Rivihabitans pingtungensis]
MSATPHPSAYCAPAWLPDGHARPSTRRCAWRRGRPTSASAATPMAVNTVDRLPGRQGMPLLWLLHGLEGGSDSHYACALMRAAQARLAWRGQPFRGCGGAVNTLPRATGRFRRSGLAAGATGQRRPAQQVGWSPAAICCSSTWARPAPARRCVRRRRCPPRWTAAAGRMLERGLAPAAAPVRFCARSPRCSATARRHPGLIDAPRAGQPHAARAWTTPSPRCTALPA